MFKYGDHMMGIQGHPEYTKDILLNLIDRLVKLDHIEVCPPLDQTLIIDLFLDHPVIIITWFIYLFLQDSESEELKAKVEAREPDREVLKRLCVSFLKGGL